MWMLYFVTFSIFILYHNKYKILLNIFSYLYPYMGWGKCSFQRADLVEGYGVRDIWITWKESERRTFWFFDFSSYLYKISFSFIIFFSQLHKKDWKWFFSIFFEFMLWEQVLYGNITFHYIVFVFLQPDFYRMLAHPFVQQTLESQTHLKKHKIKQSRWSLGG